MKTLILAFFSLFLQGNGQINYNLNPFAGFQPLQPIRPLINRPDLQNGFGTKFERNKRSPQFHQNYQPGSQSQNFNCHFGGCGNIPGMQQFHGGYVTNQGSNFNQNYFGGSSATNFGRKKRSPQFFQSFAPGSANVNCDAKGCGPAHLYPGTANLPTQFSNMMSNLNPFGQRPQQYPQQVQPGFMHFGDWPQFPQKPAAATIME